MSNSVWLQLFPRILFAVLAWLACGAGISHATTTAPALFSPMSASATVGGDALPSAIRDRQVTRARPVKIDLSQLTAAADRMSSGGERPSILLNLFDDVNYVIEVDQIKHTGRGMNLVGHLRGMDLSQVIIVANGEIVAGNISMPLGRYHIRYAGDGRHEVQAISQFLFPRDEPFVPVPENSKLDVSPQADAVPAPAAGLQGDDDSNIDVMVVYTATTRTAAGGTAALQTLIDLAVTETNQSFQNSGIAQRVRMVRSEEVAYTESGDMTADLDCLTSTTGGCLDNIHTLRDTYGADLVSFWVESGDACGIGWLMTSPSPSFAPYGFSVVARSCATGYYSFGHELGHNMGARHDVYVDTESTPYSYAHGYINTTASVPWRTIMAYNNGCAAAGKTCNRIQYWSNPAVSYDGVPMGDATADNHKVLTNTAATIANFRQSVSGNSAAQALFVNASSSANKTSTVRVVNTSGGSGTLTATAYNESGAQLGMAGASLGSMSAYQTRTFSSAELESRIGFVPASRTAKYSVYFSSDLSAFQVINYTRDVATGALTLSQAQYVDRSGTGSGSVTRSAWFVSSSTSRNKTNVLRILNTGTQGGTLSATLYDEDGKLFGSGNTSLGAIAAHQMVSYTSAQLESALGFTPIRPTAKYRVVFSATVPSLELINFTKDIATGNLTLVQAQIEDRPGSAATTSTRHVLLVNPSTSSERNTVLRIVNPNSAVATVNALAYDEAGKQVGSGILGTLNANRILALTSAQIEAAMGYIPRSAGAKYRLALTADVPTFEVIDNTKIPSNGNLYLAQAQTDNRATSTAAFTTRNAYIVYPSSGSANTTELQLINTTSRSAPLTAIGYADNGTVVASNISLGTLGANQMLTLTSAQLERAFGYTPAASAKWRIVINAALSNFEVLNYARSVSSGLLVLAQPQTE